MQGTSRRFFARHAGRRSAIALAVAGALGPWALAPADAAVCTWQPAVGNWSLAGNWSCGIVPTGPAQDQVFIGAGQTATIDDLDGSNQFRSVFTFTNAGTLNLDAFGLALWGGGSTTNTGVIHIGSASTAALQVGGGHNILNAGGLITIGSGSVLNQFGSTISGGTITTTGSGALVAFNSSSSFLDGLTLNGTLDLASNTGIERITGGLTLNGTARIGSGSVFAPQGDQTISGAATITFVDGNAGNRFNVEAGNLTLAGSVLVHGQTGFIGQQAFSGGVATLTNQGTISADVGGGAITVDVNGGVVNQGMLSAKAGGTLWFNANGPGITNTGTLLADNGTVVFNGTTVSGGTLASSNGGTFVGTANANNVFSGVTLAGVLDLASGNGIVRVRDGMALTGTVQIGSGSQFAPQGDQTITGSGSIVFADGNPSNRLNVEAGNLVIDSGITVRGNTGYIGAQSFVGGAASLTNKGTIQADVSGGTITLAVQGPVTNQGTLAALNGGTLLLNSSINNLPGSQILAAGGGTVVQNGVTLNGAVNVASGAIRVSASGSNFFDAVSFSGLLDLASSNSIERVANGLTLNGATIQIGAASILAPQGNQTIGGTGTILFADSNPSNRLDVEAGNLVIGSGITVRGDTGYIGSQNFVGGAATLTNNGTIQADVAGGTVTLAVQGQVTNNGTLAARDGGTLLLNNSIVNTPGSQIVATGGGRVVQNGVTLNGAINVASGAIQVSNSGSNFFDTVSFTGVLDLATSTSIERVVGGLTLNGATVRIANASILAPQGDQTIGGTGTILFADDNGSNRFNVEAGNLVLASGIVLRGHTGYIGSQNFAGGASTLTNNGTIQADVAGGTITLAVNSPVINNGTLAALNGGTLLLNSSVVNYAGSQIVSGAGSTVVQNGVTLNGSIHVLGSGAFRASNSGNNFLDSASFIGVLDMATATGIERVVGGLTLNGTVLLAQGSILAPQGDQTIGGAGTVVFTDSNASNRFNVEAGNLTLGSGILLHGHTGYIGSQSFAGGAATLTIQGTIAADVAGGTITADVNGGIVNQGTLQASNGGTLWFNTNGPGITNTGSMVAGAGGTIVFNSTSVHGGALNGAGRFVATGSGSNFLNGVTLNGTLDLASTFGIERVTGGMVLNGTVQLGGSSILAPQGDNLFTGSGSIVFADGIGSNRLNIEAGKLILDTGITVRGNTGVIGQQIFVGGASSLTNRGTINSDGGGTITVAVNGPFTNDGTARAQNGTLTIQNALAGSGTLQVDAAGTVNLANAANTQGRLLMGSGGATLHIGPQNLVITGDYLNVAAGSGDSFNKRRGILDAGLVLAGGDVTQAVTGAGITGGTTANPVLTIGNVRVGSTTLNYQIANLGTSGPTLRGALQTGVNGGNISDPRLSGSGVTPGLYSTGGPGSSSGNFAVTLTIGGAGPLAVLSGQAVNLTSNFSNIGDQTLSIVMGAGAGAYNAATGLASPSPLQLAAQRVGGTLSAVLNVANTAVAGSFSEDLNASFSGFTGAASGSGVVTGLVAGSSSGALGVAVDTATSGAKTGTVTVAYQTAGTVGGVSNGLGVASAGAQTVAVGGNVYAPAVAQAATIVNFGTVRVGDVVAARGVGVANTASGALTDTLQAGISTGGAPFTAAGSVSGLAAGGSSASGLVVGLDTAAAGVYSGSATVTLASHNPEMADLPLGTTTVTLTGQVNNLAKAGLAKQSGAGSFSGGAASYTLNFGTVALGGSGGSAVLGLANLASGPADALAGSFDLSALMPGDPFSLSGFGSFAGLAAGSTLGGLTVGFTGTTLGSFDRVLVLNSLSTNGSGPDLALAQVTLHLQGSVVAVPEPGTWATLLAGLSLLATRVARRRRAA